MTAELRDRYAVLGHPVAHSQSPFIHAAFAAQSGQSIDYGRVGCPVDGFSEAVRAFAAQPADIAAGLGTARGCNVTIPFKFEAASMATTISERAARAGAANTLRFDAAGWFADNTDGVGLLRDIEHNAQQGIAGLRVLLVGAGGGAAGVLGPLLAAAPREVVVVNRHVERAQALAASHAAWAHDHAAALRAAALDEVGRRGDEAFDIVVNCSATSVQGEPPPVAAGVLAPGALAIDLMYGSAAEPFLDWARRHGARPRDGLGMLVEQAAESFWIWRGVRPEAPPVLAALREHLRTRAAP